MQATLLRVRAWLIASTVAASLLGLLAIAGRWRFDWPELGLHSLLSLSYEANLPTWHASMLAFVCALLLFVWAPQLARDRLAARVLGVGFVVISIDELVGLHELLSEPFQFDSPLLHFGWVVPAGVLVLGLGAGFVPFLRHLPRGTAARFILAGGLYVGGAVGMELPLGAWTAEHGDDGLGYALIDWLEETLEIAGMTVFACTLLPLAGLAPLESAARMR